MMFYPHTWEKSHIFKIMPHELYSPIRGVDFRAYDLKKNYQVCLPDKAKDILNDIQSEIESLKFFAYENPLIIAGQEIKISKEEGYIYDRIIFKWANILRNKAQISSLSIDYNPDEVNNIPKIFIDFKRVEHIIFNLLTNAIAYSYEDTRIKINVAYDDTNQQLIISVVNIGIGLPEDTTERNKIFDFGYRAPNALQRRESGFGIGLFVARKIAQSHGGDIKCWPEKISDYNLTFLGVLKKINNNVLTTKYYNELIKFDQLEKDYMLKESKAPFLENIVRKYLSGSLKDNDIEFFTNRATYKNTFEVILKAERKKL